jgi:predicted secreted protein
MPQDSSRYIKKVLVVVDKNPFPFAGEFEFTPAISKADIALRIRVNTYSYIRAKAEITDIPCESPTARYICMPGKTYRETYKVVP